MVNSQYADIMNKFAAEMKIVWKSTQIAFSGGIEIILLQYIESIKAHLAQFSFLHLTKIDTPWLLFGTPVKIEKYTFIDWNPVFNLKN